MDLPQFEEVISTGRNTKDVILREKGQIHSKLTSMKNAGKIDNKLFEKIKPRGSHPPRLYGLAKVHKADTPLQVAEWLAKILEA